MPQKWFIFAVIFLAIAFSIGLIYFARLIPSKPPASMQITTDAIVVLTGGKNRIETGIKLLEANPAKLLFITGIETKTQRIKTLPAHLQSQMKLGPLASTTRENAAEAKAWIESNKINSITVVTANYHMPRSLLEFRHALPKIKIESYPAFTPGFKLKKRWQHFKTAKLLCKEYIKFLAVQAQYFLSDLF